MSRYTATLDTKDGALEVVGGKGRSLARMANAGFNVPGGFRLQRLPTEASLSDAIANEITAAYNTLEGSPAVAVRSSANAEDLPGLSFAGQQETYLNVGGADAVVAAVRDCWASLWTPQAISYRHQNDIDQHCVAMAVVVQIMVPSEVSGILFTANPATGERSEVILNANFGLGEAVVSGQVTPDTYIVSARKYHKSLKNIRFFAACRGEVG